MSQSAKSYILPLAMFLGGLFYEFFSRAAMAVPYFIFAMLFFTFCKLLPKDIRFHKLHGILLLVQTAGGLVLYFVVQFFDVTIAQAVFMCVLAPAAMAAAVITGMLGGNVGFVTTYILISNVGTALLSPFIFSFLGVHAGLPFLDSFLHIAGQLVPVLILPLAAAWGLHWLLPAFHKKITSWGSVTFYIWAVSLTCITGRTVKFLVKQPGSDYSSEIAIAALSLLICIAQFKAGKKLGSPAGERIATGQSMGQKNTILAIWMSQSYLNPAASVGPASYVLWQNIVNSYQLWLKNHREKKQNVSKKTLAGGENIA